MIADSQISWLRTEIMKAEKINQIYFCDLWLKYDKAFADSDELYIQLLMLLNSKFKLQTYVDLITSNFEMKKSFEVRSSVIISLVKVRIFFSNVTKIFFTRPKRHDYRGLAGLKKAKLTLYEAVIKKM